VGLEEVVIGLGGRTSGGGVFLNYIVLQAGVKDMKLWHLHPSKKYNVGDAYYYLLSVDDNITSENTNII